MFLNSFRKQRSGVAIALLVALSSASSALADGMARGSLKDDVGTYSWRGFYFGINAGWADVSVDRSIVGSPFWATGAGGSGTFSQDHVGMTVGGHLGYNFTSGPWVYGVDATLSKGNGADTKVSPFFPASDNWTAEVEWMTTITGRFGYAYNRTLYYAKGGYAGASIESSVVDRVTNTAVCGPAVSVPCHAGGSNWHNGWTVGVGIEHAIHPNVTLGLEYNYIDLGSERSKTATSAAASTVLLDQSVDAQIHSVTARLSVKLP
jgi:outer membrane immunogenic protein